MSQAVMNIKIGHTTFRIGSFFGGIFFDEPPLQSIYILYFYELMAFLVDIITFLQNIVPIIIILGTIH